MKSFAASERRRKNLRDSGRKRTETFALGGFANRPTRSEKSGRRVLTAKQALVEEPAYGHTSPARVHRRTSVTKGMGPPRAHRAMAELGAAHQTNRYDAARPTGAAIDGRAPPDQWHEAGLPGNGVQPAAKLDLGWPLP